MFYLAHIVSRFLRFLALALAIQTAMDSRQPGASHWALAQKVAGVAMSVPPLPKSHSWGNVSGTARLLTATVAQESAFGLLRHPGDGGHSYGVGQIWGRPDLENDDDENLRESWRQIEVSFEMCGDLEAYLSGKCMGGKVRQQSDRRLGLAKSMKKEIP
jgi:hypothetical protein